MEKYTLLQNILLGLTLAAPIGPVNLEIIKRGLKSGFKQAFLTGAGAMSADATYLTLIFFGLTAFLNIALMKIILGVAGSLVLIYLGAVSAKEFFNHGYEPQSKLWKQSASSLRGIIPSAVRDCSTYKFQRVTFRLYTLLLKFESHNKSSVASQPQKRLFRSAYATGYVLAISSPMTIIWWTGVFGALLTSQTQTQTNLSAFFSCLSILLGCFLWVFSLATALHWGKKIVNEKIIKLISLFAGCFLIVFGIYFLVRAIGLIVS